MKTNYYLIMAFFLVPFIMVNAQKKSESVLLGTSANFVGKFKNKVKLTARENSVSVQLPDKRQLELSIDVEKTVGKTDVFIGKVKNKNSTFHLRSFPDKIEGNIVLKEEKEAFKFYSDGKKNVYLEKVDINEVLCIDYQKSNLPTPSTSPATNSALAPGQSAYTLESLPGATAVVMLDFDGQYVPASIWGNPIDALPSGLSESEIFQAWQIVSEDYRPFNLNITTSETIYQNAPANRRMRAIVTPTTTAGPGYGGIAYIGSFTWGDNTPCWVFNPGAKYAGETCSHEIGHTVGLTHDGTDDGTTHQEYFYGQGNWAPIMGAGYYVNIVQWSKGEYKNANNQQDDVEIIAGTSNGFGFRPDLEGNTNSTATPLIVDGSGIISSSSNFGLIENHSDVDVFSFVSNGSSISLTVNPDPDQPDLDIFLTLKDANDNVIGTYDSTGLSASLKINLGQGTYYLTIQGTGSGDPFTNGYSSYASIGAYSISGNIAPTLAFRDPENPTNTANGLDYSYYEGFWNNLPDFTSLSAIKTGTVATFDISPRNTDDQFGFNFTGYVDIPTDGIYTFYTSSDDGSKLYIGNNLIVDNDGLHGGQEQSGSIGLRAGKHAITVDFFEQGGGQILEVSYSSQAILKTPIPSTALFRDNNANNQFSIIGKTIALKSNSSGNYVSVRLNLSDNPLQAIANVINSWEMITIEDAGSGNIALKSAENGKYVTAWIDQNPDAPLLARADVINDWEKFEWIDAGDGFIALKAVVNSKFVTTSADGSLQARANAIGVAEKFVYTLPAASTRLSFESSAFENEKINVYPNPSNGHTTISYTPAKTETISLHLIDDQGRLIKRLFEGNGKKGVELTHSFNTNNFNGGLYIVHVKSSSSIIHKKLIINK